MYWFVVERHPEASQEIKSNYITTVGVYYQAAFEKYIKGLLKVQTEIAGKADLMGAEESARKGMSSFDISMKIMKLICSYFSRRAVYKLETESQGQNKRIYTR